MSSREMALFRRSKRGVTRSDVSAEFKSGVVSIKRCNARSRSKEIA